MADEEVPKDPESISIQDDTPISIESDAPSSAPLSGVRVFGAAARGGMGAGTAKSSYKRPLNNTGQGATRCRLFHTRIAQAPLEHLESQINQWLDNDNIEIKSVGHVVGTFEGKNPEPNFIVMVWY